MVYIATAACLFAVLYGESAWPLARDSALNAAVIALFGVFFSLYIPRRLFRYSKADEAAAVLSRLIQRAAVGSVVLLMTTVLVWLIIGRFDAPQLLGELYAYFAIGVFLFQGFGETVTGYAMYLQRTHQYNSNQLVAVLLTVSLAVFVLVLYFLSFDLGRPPELHAYVRDITVITLTVVGYGRAVYLIAHH